ncbi:hypothetical protein VE04_08530 [Pseudogymnoascus sp. 24MN13]|nr:hypothetical protein VE04_08530 [Pseudogymnoascus sp. 24MN13]
MTLAKSKVNVFGVTVYTKGKPLLDPARPAKNLLPEKSQFNQKSFSGGIGPYKIQKGDTVCGTNNINKRTWYGKVGRTTECTAGEHSLIRTNMKWDDIGLISDEYEFRSLDSGKKFADGGDSGSLVFNLKGEWVGMLFAANTSTECGYVTPVHELIKDIEETTGGTITLA